MLHREVHARRPSRQEAGGKGPGLPAQQGRRATPAVTSRGWLHRSRIQNYQSVVRYAWILGFHDALREGQTDLARARAVLGIAFADQTSCDRGSFLLSQETTLEPPPLSAAFAAHHLPETWENQHSKLVDARWLELFLHKIKELSVSTRRSGESSPPGNGRASRPTRRRLQSQNRSQSRSQIPKEGQGKGGGVSPPLKVVPGRLAPTASAPRLWNVMTRWLLAGRHPLQAFCTPSTASKLS